VREQTHRRRRAACGRQQGHTGRRQPLQSVTPAHSRGGGGSVGLQNAPPARARHASACRTSTWTIPRRLR
jgi:hypothetical protein